jgi:hypothetical protein
MTKGKGMGRLIRRVGSHASRHVIAYTMLFVLVGGVAGALPGKNTVDSGDIINGQVKAPDLKNGAVTNKKLRDSGVTTEKVADDSLTGNDINESTLSQVPNAATLGGLGVGAFLRSTVYRTESALSTGTALGDGTHVNAHECLPGDRLLAGGPANISATTDLLESFPHSTTGWSARINNNGASDSFNVVLLCVDQ